MAADFKAAPIMEALAEIQSGAMQMELALIQQVFELTALSRLSPSHTHTFTLTAVHLSGAMQQLAIKSGLLSVIHTPAVAPSGVGPDLCFETRPQLQIKAQTVQLVDEQLFGFVQRFGN